MLEENRMNGRLIFYVGQIEPLDLFTMEFVEAFRKMHYEIFVYDLKNTKDSIHGLEVFCQKPVDAIITFNSMFYNMKLSNGNNAWDELGITYITILVDHPVFYAEALREFNENDVALCIDRKHMDYIGRFLPNVFTYGFLPHGGAERGEGKKLFSERKMDVMYAGGIPDVELNAIQLPNYIFEKYNDLFAVEEVIREIILYLISKPLYTIEQGIEYVLRSRGVCVDDEILGDVISDFVFVHAYMLGFWREKVLEVVARAGIELYIFGRGWEKFEWTMLPNVHLEGMISAEQVLKEMSNAKVVLSTMAWFKDGAHERIFNGLLAKALVFSENTTYMSETFHGIDGDEEQDIMLFDLSELNVLPERIKYMLSHADEAQAIINRGYSKAKEMHTWEMRAKEMKDALLSS